VDKLCRRAGWDLREFKAVGKALQPFRYSALGILSQNYDPETNEVSFGLCCCLQEKELGYVYRSMNSRKLNALLSVLAIERDKYV
jgi:hypothetical protein